MHSCDQLDIGVHLNLTHGRPLTRGMRQHLETWNGCYAGKFIMARKVLTGRLPVEDVEAEWAAQIDRCLAFGLHLRFLNSHEHMHMLPQLFPVVLRLAQHYDIAHVRFTSAANISVKSLSGLFRNIVIGGLGRLNRSHSINSVPHFLGLDISGRLNMQFLHMTVPSLERGQIYELMCHPGQFDSTEIQDPRLRSYHNWEGELRVLTSPRILELFDDLDVRTIGYRNLVMTTQGLTVSV